MATDGLLSEAKSNLPKLKENQAFANMSFDRLQFFVIELFVAPLISVTKSYLKEAIQIRNREN